MKIEEDKYLTFACYSQQNDATRFLDVRCNQALDKSNIITASSQAFSFSAATDVGNEALKCTTQIYDYDDKKKQENNLETAPGKSQKERSATSGPLICRDTQLLEKLNSESWVSSAVSTKNCLDGLEGFNIAL